MKAINSSIRARSFFGDITTAKNLGQSSVEKRINRRSERARLKMSLVREIQGSTKAEAEQLHIERSLQAERIYRDLIELVSDSSGHPVSSESCIETPPGRRLVWTETSSGRRIIASCDCV